MLLAYDDKNKQQTLYLNTGWSSSLNRYERRLLTLEATLVTAHGWYHALPFSGSSCHQVVLLNLTSELERVTVVVILLYVRMPVCIL